MTCYISGKDLYSFFHSLTLLEFPTRRSNIENPSLWRISTRTMSKQTIIHLEYVSGPGDNLTHGSGSFVSSWDFKRRIRSRLPRPRHRRRQGWPHGPTSNGSFEADIYEILPPPIDDAPRIIEIRSESSLSRSDSGWDVRSKNRIEEEHFSLTIASFLLMSCCDARLRLKDYLKQ